MAARFRIATFLALSLAPVPVAAAPNEDPAPVVLDAPGRQAVAGINRFSLELYGRTLGEPGNVFVAPASVSTAVALAYRGAKGATADELRAVLHYAAPPETALAGSAALLRSLAIDAPDRTLRVSNALWVQDGLPLRPEYLADIERLAGGALRRVDFRRDHEAARQRINGWVAEETRGKITDLLAKDDITESTRAALVNTLYWKGRWARPFETALTRRAPFTGLDGKAVPAMLMEQRERFRVLARGGVRAIALPYAGGEVELVALLPDMHAALPGFERRLTSAALDRWLADLDAAAPRDTVLTLPRMHLAWRRDLVPELKALGAATAFGDAADFGGMATIPYPGEVTGADGLKIARVIHQTQLDVDEEGSEAAAATAVVMDILVSGLRLRAPAPPPFVFRADKPFLFLLRDTRTHLILFVGRYVAPPSAG